MTQVAVDSIEDWMQPTNTIGAVVRAVAIAFAVTGLLIAGAVTLAGSTDWWRGLLGATVATLMASVATIPIIVWSTRFAATRPDLAAGGALAAAGVRALIALGAAMLAVKQGGYPKLPTLLLVVPYYFALLSAETFILARLMWTARTSGSESAPTEDQHE